MAAAAPARVSSTSQLRGEVAVVLLVAAPAVIVPGGLDRFVFGKLLVAAIGVGLAFTVAPRGRLTTLARALLGAAVAVLVVSALASSSPVAAFFGRQPLSEGVFVLGTYLLAGLSGVRLLGPSRTSRTLGIALSTMAWCVLAVALLAVLEATGLRPLSSNLDRPGSLLGNASDEGAFALLYGGPLAVAALQSRKPLLIAGAVAAAVTAVLSASRGALIGLVVVLIVVAVFSAARARWIALGSLAGAGALAMAVPFTRDRIFALTPLSSDTISGRGLLWHESLALFGNHPVLGVGPSQFEVAISSEHDFRWQHTVGPANPPGSPHNWILQALVVGGPVLLVLALVLGGLVVRGALRQRQPDGWATGALAGLAGYAVALLFHFTAPSTAIPAALLAGSLLAVPVATAGVRDRWVRFAAVGSAAVLALCFLLSSVAELYLRAGNTAVASGRYGAADSAYSTARWLRPWDVDLPVQALHQFVAVATSGHKAAVPYAQRWTTRVGAVADDEQVVQNRAALLQATGDYGGALRLLAPAIRNDPNDPMLLMLRGVVVGQNGDYAAAARDFRRVTVITPEDPQPWQDLAVVYHAQGHAALSAAAAAKAKALQAKGK